MLSAAKIARSELGVDAPHDKEPCVTGPNPDWVYRPELLPGVMPRLTPTEETAFALLCIAPSCTLYEEELHDEMRQRWSKTGSTGGINGIRRKGLAERGLTGVIRLVDPWRSIATQVNERIAARNV